MKRILSVILTLCLLCAGPFAHADVDYEADYETALTLAFNDMTSAEGLREAIDILQRLGSYKLAKAYAQYLQAVLDMQSGEDSIRTARLRITASERNAKFVEDLETRGFPSCQDIQRYAEAREMEAAEDFGGAFSAYAEMSILDAPDRAVEMILKIDSSDYTVDVIHRTEKGERLAESKELIPRGGQITVNARDDFEGYVLTDASEPTVTVSVDELGNQNLREVVFVYRKLPDTVAVTVICRTDTGNDLSRETADVERGGSLTVEAKAFDGYELAGDSAEKAKVFADNLGNLSQDEVVFMYKALPAYAEVTVICRDENGAQLSAKTVRVDRGTSGTIQAEPIDGYNLEGVSSVTVKVDARGKADKPQVVFTYQRIKPKISVGDYVTFGHYPQTAAGNDNTPIEWLVLDVQDGKALLLSRYGLDAKPYNEKSTRTWEKCTLRNWLNGEFVDKAFTDQEQRAILTTDVDNSKSQGYSGWDTSGGENTQDRIFLLSYAEANKYLGVTFEDSNNMKSRVAPTAYAIKNRAWKSSSDKTADGLAAGWWWLRSPGYYQNFAASVIIDGSLNYYDVYYASGCVRPAFWLNLDSGIF